MKYIAIVMKSIVGSVELLDVLVRYGDPQPLSVLGREGEALACAETRRVH